MDVYSENSKSPDSYFEEQSLQTSVIRVLNIKRRMKNGLCQWQTVTQLLLYLLLIKIHFTFTFVFLSGATLYILSDKDKFTNSLISKL